MTEYLRPPGETLISRQHSAIIFITMTETFKKAETRVLQKVANSISFLYTPP
jgi:hypothetical protein